MLKLTYETAKGGTSAIFEYEIKFKCKIELAQDLPNYKKLENHAQKCINEHTGFGYSAIVAAAFMDKINSMTDAEFLEWAKTI